MLRKNKKKIAKSHLKECFNIIGESIKTHGWGIASTDLLQNYPFYSVDSTSWLIGQKFRKRLYMSYLKIFRKIDIKKKYTYKYLNLCNIRTLIKMEKEITELWKRRGIKWKK